MADVSDFVKGFIMAIVAVVISVSLLPVLNTTIENANITDTAQASMIGIVGLLVVVGIVMFVIRSFVI